MAAKKTAKQRVLDYLSRRKTPATVFEIETATGVYETTARNVLTTLRKEGKVVLVGREQSRGYTGRPANRYLAA